MPDGTLYQAPATFHTSVSHYCYPDVGIEMTLGDTPVVRCSRWDPMDEHTLLRRVQETFLGEERGREYTRQVEAWELARTEEAREAQEADSSSRTRSSKRRWRGTRSMCTVYPTKRRAG